LRFEIGCGQGAQKLNGSTETMQCGSGPFIRVSATRWKFAQNLNAVGNGRRNKSEALDGAGRLAGQADHQCPAYYCRQAPR